jgi:hypothetical protein
MRQVGFLGFVAALLVVGQPAAAEVLITKAEAAAPPARSVPPTRGLTRGPGIEQISPGPDQKIRSPLRLKIQFQTRNNVEVDPASIKLVYLKQEPIDLTGRIKPHIRSDGIQMERAEVPPGLHTLRIDLRDKQGRVASTVIKLDVTAD